METEQQKSEEETRNSSSDLNLIPVLVRGGIA